MALCPAGRELHPLAGPVFVSGYGLLARRGLAV